MDLDHPGRAGVKVVVVFLQNAWSPVYTCRHWPRASWLTALRRSRSGQRLRVLESAATDVEFYYDNTTPEVGPSPDSSCEPDHHHVSGVLQSTQPDAVVACGKQAAATIRRAWEGPTLLVPHPASRTLTNDLYKLAGLLLSSGLDARLELRQEPSGVVAYGLVG